MAITVEGANILTRSLITFDQGAVRCRPYVMAEMQAVDRKDTQALGQALLGHASLVARNLWRTRGGHAARRPGRRGGPAGVPERQILAEL